MFGSTKCCLYRPSTKAIRWRGITARMRGAAQGGPHSMDTLQVGDWVQSDSGATGTITVLTIDGRRAYVEVAHGTLGAGMVSFLISQLHKMSRPTPNSEEVSTID